MLPITALLNLTDEPPVISTPPSISACSALNSKLLAVPILAAPERMRKKNATRPEAKPVNT